MLCITLFLHMNNTLTFNFLCNFNFFPLSSSNKSYFSALWFYRQFIKFDWVNTFTWRTAANMNWFKIFCRYFASICEFLFFLFRWKKELCAFILSGKFFTYHATNDRKPKYSSTHTCIFSTRRIEHSHEQLNNDKKNINRWIRIQKKNKKKLNITKCIVNSRITWIYCDIVYHFIQVCRFCQLFGVCRKETAIHAISIRFLHFFFLLSFFIFSFSLYLNVFKVNILCSCY